MVEEYTLKIKEIITETKDTKTFKLDTSLKKIDFKPGQFFMFRFKDDDKLKRAYSIASSPTQKSLDITLNLVGVFTKKLFESKIGDEIIAQGPYGKFFFDENMKQNLLLIGGGTGIAVLHPITRAMKESGNKVTCIIGSRNKDLLILEEKMKKASHDLIVCTDDGSVGRKGFVTEALKEVIDRIDRVVVIGPPIMMKFVTFKLLEFNFAPKDIYLSMLSSRALVQMETEQLRVISGILTVTEFGMKLRLRV